MDVFIRVPLYLTITHSTCSTSCALNIEIPCRAFPERVGLRILSVAGKVRYRLEQAIISVVEKNEQS